MDTTITLIITTTRTLKITTVIESTITATTTMLTRIGRKATALTK